MRRGEEKVFWGGDRAGGRHAGKRVAGPLEFSFVRFKASVTGFLLVQKQVASLQGARLQGEGDECPLSLKKHRAATEAACLPQNTGAAICCCIRQGTGISSGLGFSTSFRIL